MSISTAQFESLSQLLKEETAVVISSGKEYLVESRLTQIASDEGFASIGELIDRVLSIRSDSLARRVLLALTTHETSFFRDVAPFEALRTALLPELIKRRAKSRSLTIWSAACASGQEAYSVAMLLSEAFPELSTWDIKLLASDINPWLLSQAREGLYSPLEVNRGLPARLLLKYFTQEPHGYRVKEELRNKISFFERNLVKTWPPFQADIILLRNVLIYFDLGSRLKVLKAIHRSLAPDGYLMMGTAESPRYLHNGFEPAHIQGANVFVRA
jgi:chemotaxis protein methyltransferase CheR